MNIIETLLHDPLTYVLVVATWLSKRYLEHRIPAGVDQRFAEKLESHRQSLEVLTEQARFTFQRQLTDFELFASRKHNAGATVWEACRIAHGQISALWGFSIDHTFEEFNAADISAHMDARSVPKGKQEEVIALWQTNRAQALSILRPYLRMLRIQDADRAFTLAKNAAYLNELYLPDGIIEAANTLFARFAEWLTYAEYPPMPGEKVPRPDRQALNDSLSALHVALRSYVSQGAAPAAAPHPRN